MARVLPYCLHPKLPWIIYLKGVYLNGGQSALSAYGKERCGIGQPLTLDSESSQPPNHS
jgi:hypothetical protein